MESSSQSSLREKCVFDCNILLQFLLNPSGPAGRCVKTTLDGNLELLLSAPVLSELRELPEKAIAIKNGLDDAAITRFIVSLLQNATFLEDVNEDFHHPVDPDDSCYVNLAISEGASIIVSRDRHLLGLNDVNKPWSADFRARFPILRILTVEQFLRELDAKAPHP